MKKVYVVLSLLLVFSLLLSACGENNAPSITEWTDLDGKTLAVFGLAVSEDDFAEMINSKLGIELKSGVIVPTPAEMALLIQNGQVDAGSTHVYNAKYICARNDDLDYIVGKTMAASMVFVKGSGLKSEIDQAIAALKADGTIDNLVDTWLSDEAMKSDPQPAVLETIPGADTIKVGISGVLAPMDYATADGKPGGGAAFHQGGGCGLQGLLPGQGGVENDLVRIREPEIGENHLVKAQLPQLAGDRDQPGQGAVVAGVQPVALILGGPQIACRVGKAVAGML